MSESDESYEVGYAKPPKATQFRPGRSGNPKGRPKGVRNFSTEVRATSLMPVVVVENGAKKKTPTQRGALLKLREMALKGNQPALDRCLALAARYNDQPLPASSADVLAAEDQAILDEYVERMMAIRDVQLVAPKPASPPEVRRAGRRRTRPAPKPANLRPKR